MTTPHRSSPSRPSAPSPASSNGAAASSGSLPALPIRTISEADEGPFYESLLTAFAETEPDEERELLDALWERDRSIAAFDGDLLVGTAGAYSFRITVPGGAAVPTAGVSMVSVAATHRRRGILRSLMRRQLDDVRERGEPLAALTASEGVIYGRFGYGLATQALQVSVPRRRVGVQEVPGIDGYRLRAAGVEESRQACERIYAAEAAWRPGMLVREASSRWAETITVDPPSRREGARPLQVVLAERPSDGEVVGYARYQTKPRGEETGDENLVTVRDIRATEPAAYAALWRFLLATDLVRDVEARYLPEDDALPALLTDLRPVRRRLRDQLYLRPVEVGAALSARRYAAEVDAVVEVVDDFCPWNTGRWRLSGSPEGASCARTPDAADVSLTARELGSAYLGGLTLRQLADAGRVVEHTPGAVGRLSAAFRSEWVPFLPDGF